MPPLYLSRKRGAVAEQTDERKIHVRLDSELHRLVRIRRAELDITIQDYVVRLLEGALRSSGKEELGASATGQDNERSRPSPSSRRRR